MLNSLLQSTEFAATLKQYNANSVKEERQFFFLLYCQYKFDVNLNLTVLCYVVNVGKNDHHSTIQLEKQITIAMKI